MFLSDRSGIELVRVKVKVRVSVRVRGRGSNVQRDRPYMDV